MTILWLYSEFKGQLKEVESDENIREAISSICLVYDNMCHMDSLKISIVDIPLQSPFNEAWKLVSKVIDRLHLRNHVDPMQATLQSRPKNLHLHLIRWHASKHLFGQVDLKR